MTCAERAGLQGQRGMTLVELMVVAVVIGLLLVIVDRVFLSVHIASRKVQLAADVQQNARSAVARLTRELRESRGSMLICYPEPGCSEGSTQVAFPSARPSDTASIFCIDVALTDAARGGLQSACPTPIPLTGTYLPVWQRYIAYHRTVDGELRRLVQSTPVTLPVAEASGQVVATSVEAFEVGRSGRTVWLSVRGRGQEAVQGGPLPAQEVTLEGVIELRNCVSDAVG